MLSIGTILHYVCHLLFPGLLARLFFSESWKKAWLIMLATMLVDLDHLLATPVFAPDRCSIGLHPLHTWPAIALYVVMLGFPRLRVIGVGLLWHMATDGLDCVLFQQW